MQNPPLMMSPSPAERQGVVFEKLVWSVEDVARELQVSERYVYKLVSNDRIPYAVDKNVLDAVVIIFLDIIRRPAVPRITSLYLLSIFSFFFWNDSWAQASRAEWCNLATGLSSSCSAVGDPPCSITCGDGQTAQCYDGALPNPPYPGTPATCFCTTDLPPPDDHGYGF